MIEKITENCTGCRACEQICPRKSISMQPDKEGFIYPVVDAETCIDCGACKKICPQNKESHKSEICDVYALVANDKEILSKSSSGALFAVLAKSVIEMGGYVVGCVFNENIVAQHIVTNNIKDIEKLQSSKYVQSDTLHVFTEVKNLLKDGKTVLFSGTGCQVAGLKSFLRKDYDNLITCDLICHGVPSPKLFEKYKEWWSLRKKGDVRDVNFRDKKKQGWGLGYKVKVKVKVKDYYSFAHLDPYYFHFLEGNIYRRCCYDCHYNYGNRLSDITMGDYWGLLDCHPEFYDLNGVSVAVVNTSKGRHFLQNNLSNFKWLVSNFDSASKSNKNLLRPTQCNEEIRDRIYSGIDELDAITFFERNFPMSKVTMMKFWLKSKFPANLKLSIKKMLKRWK